ncbi:Uncharacterised protein [BD1-7 clade bacterium]|uniref:Type 4 fimbrial biogenesis protein PilX N-terminal domain-containing protein n=1 Tax=BD1-7 clade bacterium TaxID=2029982 RepID=A0A5S9PW43_9GAMM|nr:Uncharacterised protein [BD1-7 clade bacterium]CAA0108742.1 Uncharacterised protein [BD1-7 clade bacterium]
MTIPKKLVSGPVRQQGAVLVVSLIMLTILTLYAVSSSKESTITMQSASSLKISNHVHSSMELAVAEAMGVITALTSRPEDGALAFYTTNNAMPEILEDEFWESGSTQIRVVEQSLLNDEDLEVKYFIVSHGEVVISEPALRDAGLGSGFGVEGDTGNGNFDSYQIIAWARWAGTTTRIVEVYFAKTIDG